MKNSIFESASAAIAPRKRFLAERRESSRLDDAEKSFTAVFLDDHRLAELLGFDKAPAVESVLKRALLQPLTDLTTNPGKRIRAQLVLFGYRLLSGDRPPSPSAAKRCQICAEAIELIHAGSLVVDDIEDGSAMRRGRPALHVRYGIPVALNTGNWLYFWPFQLLKNLGLSDDDLLLVYESYHRTLLRAHFGQALDLGTRVDNLAQDSVAGVCLASMQLKTGALMGFAALLGGALADASERSLSIIDDFGRELGVALQMFDDLGNVIGMCEPSKRYEDLILSRPSWVWACAAQISTGGDYREFTAAAQKLPEAGELVAWMERHRLVQATRQSAHAHLVCCFENLKNRLSAEHVRWSARAFDELRALGEEIAVAYG